MLLFIIEIIIMILAILLGLRTAGALGCGIFAIVAQLIMIFVFQLPPGSAPVTAVLLKISHLKNLISSILKVQKQEIQ